MGSSIDVGGACLEAWLSDTLGGSVGDLSLLVQHMRDEAATGSLTTPVLDHHLVQMQWRINHHAITLAMLLEAVQITRALPGRSRSGVTAGEFLAAVEQETHLLYRAVPLVSELPAQAVQAKVCGYIQLLVRAWAGLAGSAPERDYPAQVKLAEHEEGVTLYYCDPAFTEAHSVMYEEVTAETDLRRFCGGSGQRLVPLIYARETAFAHGMPLYLCQRPGVGLMAKLHLTD